MSSRSRAAESSRRRSGFDPAEYARRTAGYEIHATKDPDAEGSFSWSQCDTCGCPKGGNRTDCVLTNPGVDAKGRPHPAVDVRSCDDCIYYAAYGHLPGEDD